MNKINFSKGIFYIKKFRFARETVGEKPTVVVGGE